MALPLIAGLPPELILSAGYVVRLNALDPTTGAPVAGVVVTDTSIFVAQLTGPDVGEAPLPQLVPTDSTV